MSRVVLFFSILLLSVVSCSNDSESPYAGEYAGELACVTESEPLMLIVFETLEKVEVIETIDQEIEIKLNESLGSMFGSIDASNNILIDPYNGLANNGTELDFLSGNGVFGRDTLSIFTTEKSMVIFFEHETEDLGICSLTIQDNL